jgi:hypothetical protein
MTIHCRLWLLPLFALYFGIVEVPGNAKAPADQGAAEQPAISRAGSDSRDAAAFGPKGIGDDWQFSVSMPGWLAGLKGDVGIKGLSPLHVDVPFSKVLEHLDMVAALSAEARHGRWSFFASGLYMKLGGDGTPAGPLVNSINLEMKEVIAEVGMAYRLWEGKRGYFDLLAGARYLYMDGEIHMDVSSSGVRQVSENLSHDLVNQLATSVQKETSAALSQAQSEIDAAVATAKVRISNAAASVKNDVAAHVVDITTNVRNQITDAVGSKIQDKLNGILENYPHVPEFVGGSGPVRDAIRQLVDAKISSAQAQVNAAKAAAAAQIQTAAAAKKQAVKVAVSTKLQVAADQLRAEADRIKTKADRAVQKAEKNLAKQIQSAITKALPENTSGSRGWVDPFLGCRGRFNFTDHLYLMARADIGGFGVSSKVDWQAYGALGWEFNRHWSTELGYRYLYIDYDRDGFLFKAATAGAYVGITYTF